MIAVLDIGKTNAKLGVATADGQPVETLSTANTVLQAPPYPHHDLAGLEAWLAWGLGELGRRHRITAIVPCGHGSGAVLTGADAAAMPMIDYEAEPPAGVNAQYRALAGSYRQRGSPIMLGASHIARQLLWLQTGWPQQTEAARWFLALPQYWAWRLSGVAASEISSLGAQSHLWSAITQGFSPIVAAQGWARLLPPLHPAWATLGPLTPDWAQRTGLDADTQVLCGIHDSSANFYRYQAGGLRGLTVVSTGTWIVALSDETQLEALDEARGMGCNADPSGAPLPGALCMGGREFALIAGPQPDGAATDLDIVDTLVGRGSFAVPSFGEDDGLFRGTAGRGHFAGPPPQSPAERRALATLTVALLTDVLLDALGSAATVVLDGSFVADPAYAALVAALRPGQRVVFNSDSHGPAAGAALLAGHEHRSSPVPLNLRAPAPRALPELPEYRTRWRRLAAASTETTP